MPIVVFAFLFGISMDYQVFIISRMREAYDRTKSTPTAVVEGIGRTGRLVTSAALILGLAFVAFSSQPGTEAKMFATALGGGILIDATIIRGLLAPALVAILGRWNWWLPARPARILRVEASPIHAEPPAQTGVETTVKACASSPGAGSGVGAQGSKVAQRSDGDPLLTSQPGRHRERGATAATAGVFRSPRNRVRRGARNACDLRRLSRQL